MNTFKKLAIAGAFAFAGSANAAMVSFEDTNNGLELTDINQTLELGLFDSTLGTLTGVEFSVKGLTETDFSLTNNAAQTQLIRAQVNVSLFLSPDFGPIVFTNPEIEIASLDTGFQSYAVGETKTFDENAMGSKTWTFDSMVDDLSAFLQAGGGALDFACASITGTTFTGGGGNLDPDQTTIGGCEATIKYTYTPDTPPPAVSAPAPLLLLGLGLGALGLRRKLV